MCEDTALSLLEAWGRKVLGLSPRNSLPTLNTKILFFCLPPSQSCTHTNFWWQNVFCTNLQFWMVCEDTALSLLEAWGCKVLGYSQRNFLPTLNTKILFFCLPPSQSCRHNTFCLQKCFLHELTILNGVRGHCSVLAGGLRTQSSRSLTTQFSANPKYKYILFCLQPSQSCCHNTFCSQKCFLHLFTILNGVRGHCSVLAGGLRTQSSRSFTTQFSAKRPQLNEKNIYAPTYLLLPLGNWGSKWGDFHWAMGCV